MTNMFLEKPVYVIVVRGKIWHADHTKIGAIRYRKNLTPKNKSDARIYECGAEVQREL